MCKNVLPGRTRGRYLAAIAIRLSGVPLAQRPVMHSRAFVPALVAIIAIGAGLVGLLAATQGGPLPAPLPLFPPTNWWNLDISSAPVDSGSASFIQFINNGGTRRLHPDFGGDVSPGSVQIYGFPYVVVDGTQPKKAVQFHYWDQSDGVNYGTRQGVPFYPIPDEAITQAHWIEGGEPGNVDRRSAADRHLLIVDRDNRHLYELYNVYYNGTQWMAGSGAFFDMNANGRRPDGWTSADAAGLAILPGLVRYDEVFRVGRDSARFSGDGSSDERVRVSRIAPGWFEHRRFADGRAAASEKQSRFVEFHARSAENLSRDAAVWIDRGRQWV